MQYNAKLCYVMRYAQNNCLLCFGNRGSLAKNAKISDAKKHKF